MNRLKNPELLQFQRYFLLTKKFNKLFGIGANKTGTTTLEYLARKIYGLKSNQRPGVASIHQLIEGNYRGFIDHMNHHDFHQDVPASIKSFYVALDALFPNSKFILTTRDSDKWFESFFNFYYKRAIRPYINPEYSKQNHPIFPGHDKRWFFYAYKHELSSLNSLKCTSPENESHLKNEILSTPFREQCILNYENRNNEIQNYFTGRPKDLLVIDISEKNLYKKINTFLGIKEEAIFYEVPHKNSKSRTGNSSSTNNINAKPLISKDIYNYPSRPKT